MGHSVHFISRCTNHVSSHVVEYLQNQNLKIPSTLPTVRNCRPLTIVGDEQATNCRLQFIAFVRPIYAGTARIKVLTFLTVRFRLCPLKHCFPAVFIPS
jgi:hypothetical protein